MSLWKEAAAKVSEPFRGAGGSLGTSWNRTKGLSGYKDCTARAGSGRNQQGGPCPWGKKLQRRFRSLSGLQAAVLEPYNRIVRLSGPYGQSWQWKEAAGRPVPLWKEAAAKVSEPFRGAGGSLGTVQKDCPATRAVRPEQAVEGSSRTACVPVERSGSLGTVQKDCPATRTVRPELAVEGSSRTACGTVGRGAARPWKRLQVPRLWKGLAAKAKLHTRGDPGHCPAVARARQGRRI